ncbi:PAS domain S-box protein [bacterium]|nr:PAS domain S-box protein [bacterium]
MDRQQRTESELRKAEEQFKAMADTSPLAIYMSEGVEQRATYINPTFIKLFGYTLEEVPSAEQWWPLAYPDENYRKQVSEEWQQKVALAIELKSEIEPMEVEVTCKDGSKRIISWGYITIGEKSWTFGHDLTHLKQAEERIKASLKEKETLLLEIHHRVKNNMQVISSLLSLQADALNDDNIRKVLIDSQNRVKAMAAVHENLYKSKNLSSIILLPFLRELTNSILTSYRLDTEAVAVEIGSDEVAISIEQALPLGLIVNELVSNSLKHAFPNRHPGKTHINTNRLNDENIQLRFSDNGIGIPPSIDWRNTNSLGLKLVANLAENQLDGSIEMEIDAGTHFVLIFKEDHILTNG